MATHSRRYHVAAVFEFTGSPAERHTTQVVCSAASAAASLALRAFTGKVRGRSPASISLTIRPVLAGGDLD